MTARPAKPNAAVCRVLVHVGITAEARVVPLAANWLAQTWAVSAPGLEAVVKIRPHGVMTRLQTEADPRWLTLLRALSPCIVRGSSAAVLRCAQVTLGERVPGLLAEGVVAEELAYTVMSRVPGDRVAPRWSRVPALRSRLSRQMGELLARLHAAPLPAGMVVPSIDWMAVLSETLHGLADRIGEQAWGHARRRRDDHLRSQQILQRLGRRPLGATVLVHNDFHPDNLLVDRTGAVSGLVDFDLAGTGPAVFDLRRLSSLDERAFASGYGLTAAELDHACWCGHVIDLLWHGLGLLAPQQLPGVTQSALCRWRALARWAHLLALCTSETLRRGPALARRVHAAQALVPAAMRLSWRRAPSPVPATERVAIVLVAWNHFATTTAPCLAALRSFTSVPYRLICVDNASSDATAAAFAAAAVDPRVEIVTLPSNVGWAAGSRAGLQRLQAGDTHVLLLNSDTLVTPGWLPKLLWHLRRLPAESVVIPREDVGSPGQGTMARAEELPIAPGTGPLPPPAPSLVELVRRAVAVEARHWRRSVAAAPSGFCLLTARANLEMLDEFLVEFPHFHARTADWQVWWQKQGAVCHQALDTFVHHARGGSGGYYAYDRVWRDHGH